MIEPRGVGHIEVHDIECDEADLGPYWRDIGGEEEAALARGECDAAIGYARGMLLIDMPAIVSAIALEGHATGGERCDEEVEILVDRSAGFIGQEDGCVAIGEMIALAGGAILLGEPASGK